MKWMALAACLLWFRAISQVVHVPIEETSEQAEIYALSDTGRLFYFIKDKKNMQVLAFDSTLKASRKGNFDLHDFIKTGSGVISLAEINKQPVIFFADEKLRSFYYAALNTDSFSITKKKCLVLPKIDTYLGCFAGNNSLNLLLLRNTGSYKLVISELGFENSIAEHEINLNEIPFSFAEGHGPYSLFFTGYQDETMLKRVNANDENTNYSGRSLSKFYPSTDKLVFTFNTVANVTQLLTIDLHTFKPSLLKIPSGSPVYLKDNVINDNSFLFSDKLFYVAVCKDYLLFKIFDALSGATLKEFITDKTMPITYMQGGLIDVNENNSAVKERDVSLTSNSKDILNELCNLNAKTLIGLGAFLKSDSVLEVTIGCSEDIGGFYYLPFLYPFWVPPNPRFAAPQIPGPPAMRSGFHLLFPALGWNESFVIWPKFVRNKYFKAYFNINSLKPVPVQNQELRQELITEKIKSMKKKEYTGAVNSIQFDGRVIFGTIQCQSRCFTLEVLKTTKY